MKRAGTRNMFFFYLALKVEYTFEEIMYITIFCFWSPKCCFKSVICPQNLLKSATDLQIFAAAVGRKPSSPDSFEDSVLIDFPFWGHLNIELHFSFLFYSLRQ